MGLGANMKGLTAYSVPIFCILLLSLIRKEWSWMPRFRTLFLAGLLSLAVYLLIPCIACIESSSLAPLEMVWHENVVRFFKPFDHKGPIYTYVVGIFKLGAPWSLLLPVGLYYNFKKNRSPDSMMMKIIIITSGIFIFFTLSGSRRDYYLLPIIPFISIIEGEILSRFADKDLPASVRSTVKIIGLLIGIVLMAPLALIYFILPAIPFNIEDPGLLAVLLILVAISGLIMIISSNKQRPYGMIISGLIVCFIYAVGIVPWMAQQPGNLKEAVVKIKELNKPVSYLYTDYAKLIFYLDEPYKIFMDLDDAQRWCYETGGVLIIQNDRDISTKSGWEIISETKEWKALIFSV